MALTFVKFQLPAAWAPAMINMDYSGLDTREITEVIKWKTADRPGICADVSNATFAGEFNGALCLMSEYKFIKL
jgi:hypothetical protein